MKKTLEQLLENMDEDDPMSMNIITKYKEQLELEDENYMALLADKLENAAITWVQPIYQQVFGVTRPNPKRNTIDATRSYDKGRIRKDEAKIIEHNWSKLIKKYNLPDKSICFARWRNKSKSKCPKEKARLFVTSYLARGVKRNLFQVYRHFLNTHAFFKKGLYNDFEQKVVNICLKFEPDKACTIIPCVLNRPPRQLYVKVDRITSDLPDSQSEVGKVDGNKPSHKWDVENGAEFLKLLLKYTGHTKVKKLKNKEIDKNVWIKIKEEMDLGIPSLRSYWYTKLHPQLFIEKDIKLKKLRKQIYSLLRTKLDTLKVWKDIDWTGLIKELPEGLTSDFVYQLAYRPMRYNKDIQELPLSDILDYVTEKLAITKMKSKTKLRRLIWTENEELVYASDNVMDM